MRDRQRPGRIKAREVHGCSDCRTVRIMYAPREGDTRTGGDDRVVSEVEIDWLGQWKCDVATVEGIIGVRIVLGDRGVAQSCNQLLNITNALSGGSRVTWTVTVPKHQENREFLRAS